MLHYTLNKQCDEDFCVTSKVNLDAPTLNRMTASTVCVPNVADR